MTEGPLGGPSPVRRRLEQLQSSDPLGAFDPRSQAEIYNEWAFRSRPWNGAEQFVEG